MDDEGVAGAEEGHGLCGEGDEMGRVDSHDLRTGAGGVRERPDQMEDGADAERATDRHDDLHRGMEGWGMEEGEAMFSQGGCAFGRGEADGDAEGFEDV